MKYFIKSLHGCQAFRKPEHDPNVLQTRIIVEHEIYWVMLVWGLLANLVSKPQMQGKSLFTSIIESSREPRSSAAQRDA